MISIFVTSLDLFFCTLGYRKKRKVPFKKIYMTFNSRKEVTLEREQYPSE